MKTLARPIYALVFGFLILIAGSCRQCPPVDSRPLDRLNWSEGNYEALNRLIRDYGIGGRFFRGNQKPYVVLDWDQTCAHFDAEEAVMRYQLTHLRFKFTKEQLRKDILRDTVNGETRLPESFRNILIAELNQDLVNDYNFLYDNYLGSSQPLALEAIQKTPQYLDFITKVPFLYEGFCESAQIGAEYGYPWVLYFLTGYTPDEVKELAFEAISIELANNISKQTWQGPAGFPTVTGSLDYSFKSGLRVFPEMQNLISTFRDRGIDVFIVSASFKPVVEVFSGIGTFGYNVPPEHVVAMELATGEDGRILPRYKSGWVKTQRQGKVDAINHRIKQELGRNYDPLFGAGDSDGDYEMLTGFPDMKLSLIWNRVKGGEIGKLCRQAVDEINQENPRFILQGRNENTGIARRSPESILFGKTVPQLLKE